MNRNVRSTRSICAKTVWWLTQMMPIVRNEIAYATYDGQAWSELVRDRAGVASRLDLEDQQRRGDREDAVAEGLEARSGLHAHIEPPRTVGYSRPRASDAWNEAPSGRAGELVPEILEPVGHVVAAAQVDLLDEAFTVHPERAVAGAFALGQVGISRRECATSLAILRRGGHRSRGGEVRTAD